jgi:dipeptidyl-peptidase-4
MIKSMLGAGFLLSFVLSLPGLAQNERIESVNKSKAADAVRFDPVLRDVEGWTISIEPALVDGEHQEEGAKALAMLANHLQRIRILVPSEQLEKLQAVGIWIEHAHPRLNAMHYHPSKDWLISHGHDARLAKKVHITHAAELLSRHQMLKHPAVILHELAHAYHDQVLSFDHPEIMAAYRKAEQSESYESVLLYTGKNVRHYGLTNHKEYFAEGTEAYFYRNDFYPFVRAELKEHDSTLHDLLEKIWGPAR